MVDLKSWRDEHSFTQAQAAAALGCSLRLWQYWEYGQREVPRMAKLAMSALDMTTDRLIKHKARM